MLEWYFVLVLLAADGAITRVELAFPSEEKCAAAIVEVAGRPVKVGEGRLLSPCRLRFKT